MAFRSKRRWNGQNINDKRSMHKLFQTVCSDSDSSLSYTDTNDTCRSLSKKNVPTSSQLQDMQVPLSATSSSYSINENEYAAEEQLFANNTRVVEHHPKNILKRKILKFQHEGKIKTVGRGLERDLIK